MSTFSPAPEIDGQARDAVSVALGATPRGVSFGRLGVPALWLAGCQGEVPPRPLKRARVVVFAGEHAIAHRTYQDAGLSAFAPEATAQQLEELESGAGPIHTLARQAHATVDVVNVAELVGAAGAIDSEDAMDSEVFEAALQLGKKTADAEVDSGADLLIPADLGVGNSTVAAAVMGALTRTEPVAVVGPGSGVTDSMWKTKVRVIRDAMFRARKLSTSPLELIQTCGSPDLAAQMGFIIQAAHRRTPVLLGSPFVAVAGALAEKLAPGTARWCLAASSSSEPAHALALDELGLTPLLSLEMNGGQGLGGLTALPLIHASIELTADEVRDVAEQL